MHKFHSVRRPGGIDKLPRQRRTRNTHIHTSAAAAATAGSNRMRQADKQQPIQGNISCTVPVPPYNRFAAMIIVLLKRNNNLALCRKYNGNKNTEAIKKKKYSTNCTLHRAVCSVHHDHHECLKRIEWKRFYGASAIFSPRFHFIYAAWNKSNKKKASEKNETMRKIVAKSTFAAGCFVCSAFAATEKWNVLFIITVLVTYCKR